LKIDRSFSGTPLAEIGDVIRDLIDGIPPHTHPARKQTPVRAPELATEMAPRHGEARRQFASSGATAAALKLHDRVDCFARRPRKS